MMNYLERREKNIERKSHDESNNKKEINQQSYILFLLGLFVWAIGIVLSCYKIFNLLFIRGRGKLYGYR